MKKPTYKGKELLPLSVIDAARDGDSQAVDQVLRYYEGYINKLCTRTLYDPDGQPQESRSVCNSRKPPSLLDLSNGACSVMCPSVFRE